MAEKRKAVVTGGAGFIGSHIADALIERGFETHVVDNLVAGKRALIPSAAIFHEVDVLDTAAMKEIFKDAYVVFHEAALPRVPYTVEHPQESHQVNVDGTLSVLTAAKDSGVRRVVFAASAAAYGNQETMPLSEDVPATPVNPYGLHKYIGECYLRLFSELYGLSTVSLRYFNVYGPRLDPEGAYALAIGRFLAQRSRGEPLTIVGDGEQTRDFVHVRDIVRANLLAMDADTVGAGEVINIGSGRSVSVNYLADLIDGGAPRTKLPPRAEGQHSLADTRKAKKLLNWEAEVTLEEGIADLKSEFGIS